MFGGQRNDTDLPFVEQGSQSLLATEAADRFTARIRTKSLAHT